MVIRRARAGEPMVISLSLSLRLHVVVVVGKLSRQLMRSSIPGHDGRQAARQSGQLQPQSASRRATASLALPPCAAAVGHRHALRRCAPRRETGAATRPWPTVFQMHRGGSSSSAASKQQHWRCSGWAAVACQLSDATGHDRDPWPMGRQPACLGVETASLDGCPARGRARSEFL